MSTDIVITDNYRWTNEHNNVTRQVLRRFQVNNDPATSWKQGLSGIQSMIGQARAKNERLRSYGGKWSLSDVAICNDSIHDSKPLTFYGTVGKNSIKGTPLFSDKKPLDKRLYYFQSGPQVSQINRMLEQQGLCLPTTGASNGQTIAGAVSTGTHGSALRIGAMQDFVRALHIVTSEDEHVFVQPKADPIIDKSFSDIFGARLITNDRIFYAALVSFGSFGVIHGIIAESVSLFMFETYCQLVDYSDVEGLYPLLKTFSHGSSKNLKPFLEDFNLPADEDPYHLDLIANPYSSTQNTYLRVMYKKPFNKAKLSPPPGGSSTRVGDDVLSLIGSVTETAGGLVSVVVNTLFGQVAEVQSGYTQTPRNVFGDSILYKPKNGGSSSELGVPIDKAAQAVRIVMTVAQQEQFAGVIGIRFVRASKATLAFTRFSPLTCTIELPGLNSDKTQAFYRQVYADMESADIPFTLHWGQEGDYSPRRLTLMYGSDLDKWIKARNSFLPDPMQRYMFTNDFMKRCGLSEPPALDGGGAIV